MSRRGPVFVSGGTLTQPNGQSFAVGNGFGTRPSTTHGTAVTPGNNAYGSVVQLVAGASVTQNIYELQLMFHDGFTSANARDMIAKIVTDPAGGTNWSTLVPNLLVSCAGTFNGAFPISYRLPVYIPAGSSIGVAASVNNVTVGKVYCTIQCYGSPARTLVNGVDYGTHVESVGITLASSSGTAVTPGQAAEGSWTLLGTTTQSAFCFLVGVGINNATMNSLIYHCDLAASTDGGVTKDILVEDLYVNTSSAETIGFAMLPNARCLRSYASGVQLYARAQCNGAPDTGFSMAAYAVG